MIWQKKDDISLQIKRYFLLSKQSMKCSVLIDDFYFVELKNFKLGLVWYGSQILQKPMNNY